MKRWLFVIGFLVCLSPASGQIGGEVVRAIILDGDTIPYVELPEVTVFSWGVITRKAEKELTKLMRNVKIVYPYAKLAGIKLTEYQDTLANVSSDKEKRRIMKQVEDEIQAEYGQELRDLTISQGKILLKLIDRETGSSSYDLVSDLRGEFAAVFYQAFARLFTYNLKVRYDPKGEDKEIEMIIMLIESGII